MSDPTTLYASGEEAISRVIDVDEEAPRFTKHEEYEEYYDIDRTAEAIIKGDYKRVCFYLLLCAQILNSL